MSSAPSETLTIDASLELALRMADRADELALAGFGGELAIERKADGSPVTSVDREIEAELRDMIATEHPNAGVLGEEFPERPGDSRWVIDPIDGTERYMDADPRFATLIALEHRGTPLVGVVSAPALGVRWWAAPGHGAMVARNGERSAARVSGTDRLENATALFLDGSDFRTRGIPGLDDPATTWDRLVETGLEPVRLVASWEAVRVASGDFDLAFTGGAWWDLAPLKAIVEEAGGIATIHGAGEARGIVVTNHQLGLRARTHL